MNGLLPRHKSLITAIMLLLAVWLCGWIFLVRPRRQVVEDGIEELSRKRESLRKRGWPLDRNKLDELLAERKRVLEGAGGGDPGLNARAEQVLHHATALFRPQIQERFGSPELFVRSASNIDFREAFNQLQRRSASHSIWLAPEILNLSETASTPYTYQLLLRVWTLDRLLDLILDHRLLVDTHPDVHVKAGRHQHSAARISVLPVKGYYLTSDSQQPYLIEIPVHLRLNGELNDVREFLDSLVTDSEFIPPVHVEIYAGDPAGKENRSGSGIVVKDVVLDIVCSAFFQFPFGDYQSSQADKTGKRTPPGV